MALLNILWKQVEMPRSGIGPRKVSLSKPIVTFCGSEVEIIIVPCDEAMDGCFSLSKPFVA